MNNNLVTITIVSCLLTVANNANADDTGTGNDRHKQYIGTGIGATAGALFAGPVGFIVGGVIGNLAGRHDANGDDTAQPPSDSVMLAESSISPGYVLTSQSDTVELIMDDDSRHDDTAAMIGTSTDSPELLDSVIRSAGLEIYFLSGSTDVKTFYKPRIQAISKLLHTVPDLDVHLEGYSDRRGDKESNLELSNARLESVRDQLVQAGIDNTRIHLKAFGEQNFYSVPGDLEGYSFDRRVVIRLQQASPATHSPVALTTEKQTI